MRLREKKIAADTCSYLKKYLSKNDAVLDIGSGTGSVAEIIKKETGAEVTCIDVIDISENNFKPIIFDGMNIPFADKSFTAVVCCFVLHHTDKVNQEKLMEEMKRVSKFKIIISEDVPQTIIDKILSFGHFLYSKIRYKSSRMIFRDNEQWLDLFKKNGLILQENIVINKINRNFFYPVSRRIYVLSFS